MNNSNQKKSSNMKNSNAMEKFKMEVADEIGVPLKDGYNGDLTSAQNGSVGGNMVKRMVEAQEQQMSNSSTSQNWVKNMWLKFFQVSFLDLRQKWFS